MVPRIWDDRRRHSAELILDLLQHPSVFFLGGLGSAFEIGRCAEGTDQIAEDTGIRLRPGTLSIAIVQGKFDISGLTVEADAGGAMIVIFATHAVRQPFAGRIHAWKLASFNFQAVHWS